MPTTGQLTVPAFGTNNGAAMALVSFVTESKLLLSKTATAQSGV